MANIVPKALKNEHIIADTKLEEFKFLDGDEFLATNKVVDIAKQRGQRNEPPSTSLRPDENELRLHQLLSQLATQATNRLNETLGQLLNSVRAIDVIGTRAELDNAVKNFHADMQAEISGDLENLNGLKTHFITENNDFERFKRENGLTRSAVYKESALNTAGWLGFILIFEVFLNMSLLAEASDFGLIGGISLASVISVLNIAIGFSLGFFVWPQINHVNTRTARLWFLFFIMALVLVVCLNLLIAHYREVLILDPANSGFLAVERFINGMLNLSDIQSIFLFLIGVGISLFAVWKGYTQNDPYPGYTAQDKKMRRISGDFYHERAAQIKRFKKQYGDALGNIEKLQQKIVMSFKNFNSFSTSYDTQLNLYRDYINHLKQTGVRAITLYRDTNKENRDDEEPGYFNNTIEIEFETNPIPDKYDAIGDTLSLAVEETGRLLPLLKNEFIEAKDKHQTQLLAVTIE